MLCFGWLAILAAVPIFVAARVGAQDRALRLPITINEGLLLTRRPI